MFRNWFRKSRKYHVVARWDDEARVWVATSDDVPGLVTEAATQAELAAKLKVMIPELLEENGVSEDACHLAPVSLLYHEEQDLILNR